MKLKRPLAPVQGRWIIGVILLGFYPLKIAVMRWMETQRIQAPSSYVFPTRELAELDRLLQARFAEVPTNNFGMLRIGPRHEIFKAIGPAEREAIEGLRRQKQEVVFYVAGRRYLLNQPQTDPTEGQLQGPVFMTHQPPLKVKATQIYGETRGGHRYRHQLTFQTEKRPTDLPTEKQLSRPLDGMLVSDSAFDHTATPEGKTYRAGAWQVVAVPVRATDQACVNCHFRLRRYDHSTPRLGDPVGIALYAFRPKPKQQTKILSVPLPTPVPSNIYP